MEIKINIKSKPIIISKDNFISKDTDRLNGVYVMLDDLRICLYVGKTKDLLKRLHQHRRHSEFYRSVYQIEFYINSNEYEKEMLETFLINELKPVYNKAKTYYKQEDYEYMLQEIEEEEHFLKAEIADIKYFQQTTDGYFYDTDDYDLDNFAYERKVDELELAELEQRLRRLQKRKYEISTRMSV